MSSVFRGSMPLPPAWEIADPMAPASSEEQEREQRREEKKRSG